MPLIMPVLKDTFYLQILRKAREALAQEHIVPMRVLFPQQETVARRIHIRRSLDSWKSRIEGEVAKWKYDPNYISDSSLPIGSQTIGRDSRAMLHQGRWRSGRSKSWQVWGCLVVRLWRHAVLRKQCLHEDVGENMFLGYRTDHDLIFESVHDQNAFAAFMGWPAVPGSHASVQRWQTTCNVLHSSSSSIKDRRSRTRLSSKVDFVRH